MRIGSIDMDLLGIAAVSLSGAAGWLVWQLPDILDKRYKHKLEIEKERTQQKELDLQTAQTNLRAAQLEAQPPHRGPTDV